MWERKAKAVIKTPLSLTALHYHIFICTSNCAAYVKCEQLTIELFLHVLGFVVNMSSHITRHKFHFQICSSTCTCAFSYSFFTSSISKLKTNFLVWNSFNMNQLLHFAISQLVSAILHASVATLKIAVIVPQCESTLSCSVCQ